MKAQPNKVKDIKKKSVDSTTKQELPGELRGGAKLTVNTWECDRLVYGRKKAEGKQPIVGLIGFSKHMKPILFASAADDPYADWYLIKVDEAIDDASVRINGFYEDVLARLSSTPGVTIDQASSKKPTTVDLSFANNYGYRGAYLLAEYDRLVCTVLTAKHVGKITKKDSYAINEAGARLIRSCFALPTTYKYFGINREELGQGTKRALDAMKHMGEVPADILSKKLRSDNAPDIKDIQGDESMDLASEREELEAASA